MVSYGRARNEALLPNGMYVSTAVAAARKNVLFIASASWQPEVVGHPRATLTEL
jgi:hypothetical protein